MAQPSASGFDTTLRDLTRYNPGSLPDDLPDDPVLLKQLLLEALARQAKTAEVLQAHEGHIVDLKEQVKLLRDRLFGRKSEQTVEPTPPSTGMHHRRGTPWTWRSAIARSMTAALHVMRLGAI